MVEQDEGVRGAGVRGRRRVAVAHLVELHLVALVPVLPQPVVAGIAHDAEQPRPHVIAAHVLEEAERPQVRFLNRVFRIAVVAQQPAREVVRRMQVRHDGGVEGSGGRGQRLLLFM